MSVLADFHMLSRKSGATQQCSGKSDISEERLHISCLHKPGHKCVGKLPCVTDYCFCQISGKLSPFGFSSYLSERPSVLAPRDLFWG